MFYEISLQRDMAPKSEMKYISKIYLINIVFLSYDQTR